MPKAHHPRRGSMQFWPRKRAKQATARVHAWAEESKAKPLGYIGYKAGMTHFQIIDQNPKSPTKGKKLFTAATIVECPPMTIIGVSFYKKSLFGIRKSASILTENPKHLKRKVQPAKKGTKKFDDIKEFDDLRLLVYSVPTKAKKPKLLEISLGGSKEDKIAYAKQVLGKTINVKDVFDAGSFIDVHGITKGKGFQGTVKRYGVPIRQKKSEKTKRGIGNLGAWTPKRVDYRVPQPGRMGFHLRTEYNKQVMKLGEDGQEVTPKSGITKYGVVTNPYLLLKGSVAGSRKRAVVLTMAIRPTKKAGNVEIVQ